jgi:hypothetical protein
LFLAITNKISILIAPCNQFSNAKSHQDKEDNTPDYECAAKDGVILQGVSVLAKIPPEWLGAISSIFIAIFTLTLWIATDRLWRISLIHARHTNRSVNAAQTSADAAKETADFTRKSVISSQRAWLTAEISLVKGQEQIVFSQDGAVLPIRIDIKNIGNSPAIKVSWPAWLIFAGSGLNPLQEQSLRCNKIRQQPFGIGPTIFPQDRYPDPDIQWSCGVGASWEEINKTMPRIMVSLVGCVDYAFPTDPDVHHQTGFVYHVSMPDSEIPKITAQSANMPVVVRGLVKADLTLDPGAL